MSIGNVLASQLSASPVKRSKSHKRKLADTESPAMAPDSRPSPTKKTKLFSSIPTKARPSLSTGAPAYTLPASDSATDSPFSTRTLSLYLPVAPIALHAPIPGLCAEHLSPLLLTYYAPLQGIVLSYSNPRVSETPEDPASTSIGATASTPLAVSVAEYGVSYIWLTADFLVLAPAAGTPIEGCINLQSETHLGLVCWNLFSANVPRARLPTDWKWIPAGERKGSDAAKKKKRKDKLKGNPDEDTEAMEVDEDEAAVVVDGEGDAQAEGDDEDDSGQHGHWLNGQGAPVSGAVTFAVVEIDAQGQAGTDQSGSFVSISGTLLDRETEQEVLKQEREEWEQRHARKRGDTRQPAYVMSGATASTVTVQTNGTSAVTEKATSAEDVKEKKKSKKDKEGKIKASDKPEKKAKKSKS